MLDFRSPMGFVAGVVEIVFESSGAVSPDPQVSMIPSCDRFNCGRARFEHAEPEAAIRLGLPATHEKAFLDDPTVPDRVKPDLIEVDAFLALWRDIQLEANDELIPVHIRTLDLKIMNFVVRVPPLGFSFHRLAPLEFCHIAGHRLTAHDVVGPEFLTGGLQFALGAHVGESFCQLLRIHDVKSFSAPRPRYYYRSHCEVPKATADNGLRRGRRIGEDVCPE